MSQFNLNHQFYLQVKYMQKVNGDWFNANEPFKVIGILAHFVVCESLKDKTQIEIPVTVFKAFAIDMVNEAKEKDKPKL